MDDRIAQLWAQLAPELTTYFEHRLPNPSDAEDFVSRTFTRLLERSGTYTPETLLWTIARGLLVNEYRDDARRTPDFEEREWPAVRERRAVLDIGGDDGMIAAAIIQTQEANYLTAGFVPSVEDQFFGEAHDEAVRDLEPEFRDAYILGELRGLTAREAGPLLGVSHTTAHARREAAIHTIRKEIAA